MTLPSSNCPRAIIRVPNWLGDCVMSLWAIRELSSAFDEIEIDILARPSASGLYSIVPFVSRVHVMPNRKLERIGFLRKLTGIGFDAGILLPNSLSSAVEMKLLSPRCIVGYRRDCRSFLLERGIALPPWEKTEHIVCYYSHLLRRACSDEKDTAPQMPDTGDFELHYPDSAIAEFNHIVETGNIARDFVVMSAGAAFGPAKQWHTDSYAETARRICAEFNMDVLLMGGHGDKVLSTRIAEQAGAGVISICGETTIAGAAYVLSKAQAFVGNDSGLMHLAALTGIPTIGLFFSTDTIRTAPIGKNVHVFFSGVKCAPCFRRECEIGYICRDRIAPTDIMSRLSSFFEEEKEPNRPERCNG